jgi:mono/diheme cytochrome c family protein
MTRGSLAIILLVLVPACGGKVEPEAGARPTRFGTGGKSGGSRGTGGRSVGSTGGAASNDGGSPDLVEQVDYSERCKGQADLPDHLECTGLYADIDKKVIAADVLPYTPAILLWSDGAEKERFISLPKGKKIDASDPNEWKFPVGTKVWKQFSVANKRMETRYFVKLFEGSQGWSNTTYAWNETDSAAERSPGGDMLAPDGSIYHVPIPGECQQCHQGRNERILGFEQVGLGLDQPGVAQGKAKGVTLADLVSKDLIDPPPDQTSLTIGDDGTGMAAPAIAWLHMNCGVTCHNGNSGSYAYGAGMKLRLDPTLLDGRAVNDFDALKTTIGVAVHTAPWVGTRIVAGDPEQSLLWHLISTRSDGTDTATAQMPPIASRVVDTEDVKLVTDWIKAMPRSTKADDGGGG